MWCYFKLPEPYGLGYLEIDILFMKRAKAAKFRVLNVNWRDRDIMKQPVASREAVRGRCINH